MKTRIKLRAAGVPSWEIQATAMDLKSKNLVAKAMARATIRAACQKLRAIQEKTDDQYRTYHHPARENWASIHMAANE